MEELTILILQIFAVATVLLIAWFIIQIVACWRIFHKAGIPGWKSLIPVYNLYLQYKICWNGRAFWLMLALTLITTALSSQEGIIQIISMLCCLASWAVQCLFSYKLSLAFGHGIGFAVGLFFLNPIFLLILAFDRSTYQGLQE